MPFTGWRRALLRAFTAVGLYLGLLLFETLVLILLGKPIGVPVYLPQYRYMVNTLIYIAIPATPLAIIGWLWRGRRKDKIAVAVAFLFAALVWIPWLGNNATPLPVDEIQNKAVQNGYEICGLYRTAIGWNTFTYTGTFSDMKRCFFIILRPEPRYNYVLRPNITITIEVLKSLTENRYTFYGSRYSFTQFYINEPEEILDFLYPSIYARYLKINNVTEIYSPYRGRTSDDLAFWFTFRPEPGQAQVRVTVNVKVLAEVATPWT
ncbi:MAG: hypothetical protein QXD32_04555 [Nitrososphaerota archaeon]